MKASTYSRENLPLGTTKERVDYLTACGVERNTAKITKVAWNAEYNQWILSINIDIEKLTSDDNWVTNRITKVKYIHVSNFAINGILKAKDETVLLDIFTRVPATLPYILKGASVSFVSMLVASGERYDNPFADKVKEDFAKHDLIKNYPYDFKLDHVATSAVEMTNLNVILAAKPVVTPVIEEINE
jgi:hypothetical protein